MLAALVASVSLRMINGLPVLLVLSLGFKGRQGRNQGTGIMWWCKQTRQTQGRTRLEHLLLLRSRLLKVCSLSCGFVFCAHFSAKLQVCIFRYQSIEAAIDQAGKFSKGYIKRYCRTSATDNRNLNLNTATCKHRTNSPC
jgi:hypothetical protein